MVGKFAQRGAIPLCFAQILHDGFADLAFFLRHAELVMPAAHMGGDKMLQIDLPGAAEPQHGGGYVQEAPFIMGRRMIADQPVEAEGRHHHQLTGLHRIHLIVDTVEFCAVEVNVQLIEVMAMQPVKAPCFVKLVAGFIVISVHSHGGIGRPLGCVLRLIHAYSPPKSG